MILRQYTVICVIYGDVGAPGVENPPIFTHTVIYIYIYVDVGAPGVENPPVLITYGDVGGAGVETPPIFAHTVMIWRCWSAGR